MSDPRSTAPPRTTVLHDRHRDLGASFTDFGGWDMPVRYTSDLAEHHAVRTAAGLFDISHMGEFLVTGADAASFLDYALAGRISAMRVGKAKYSLVLAEDGGVIDDVIVYRIAEDRFLVIANAGNRDAVAAAVAERAGRPDLVEDVSDAFALIAVQGPAAETVVEATAAVTDIDPPRADLGASAFAQASFAGESLLVARTGYTGEDGFELLVPNRHALALWDALLEAGAPHGLVPAGLAARDTLRLEAGMPLYGNELDRTTTPYEAGLGRVVRLDKTGPDGEPLPFVGREALAARAHSAPARVLVGLEGLGRRAARHGYAVHASDAPDAPVVGTVTSGAPSPTLGHPVAMAYVTPERSAEGTELAVDVRGRREPVRVVPLPFYRRPR